MNTNRFMKTTQKKYYVFQINDENIIICDADDSKNVSAKIFNKNGDLLGNPIQSSRNDCIDGSNLTIYADNKEDAITYYINKLKDEITYNSNTEYYIQKNSIDGMALWWKQNKYGYTTDILKAGKFSGKETIKITNQPQTESVSYVCDIIDNCVPKKLVIDMFDLNNLDLIEENNKIL